MVLLFAVFCVCAVAGEPTFKFDWIPPLKVIPHGPPPVEARIVGGVIAEPHKYGYQAAVIRGRDFICGGAVISEYFVLTAGHCAERMGRYYVLLGGHNLKTKEESQQIIEVDEIYIHPDFDFEDIVFDIAVLQLKAKIKMNEKVFPLKLPENNVYHGMPLVITGWGVTKSEVQRFSVLKKMKATMFANQYCNQIFPDVDDSMFCALGEHRQATICYGDTGSPAVYQNFIMGIVAFGTQGCLERQPLGFTNVYKAKDWIQDVMDDLDPPSYSPSLCRSCSPLLLLCFVLVYLFL